MVVNRLSKCQSPQLPRLWAFVKNIDKIPFSPVKIPISEETGMEKEISSAGCVVGKDRHGSNSGNDIKSRFGPGLQTDTFGEKIQKSIDKRAAKAAEYLKKVAGKLEKSSDGNTHAGIDIGSGEKELNELRAEVKKEKKTLKKLQKKISLAKDELLALQTQREEHEIAWSSNDANPSKINFEKNERRVTPEVMEWESKLTDVQLKYSETEQQLEALNKQVQFKKDELFSLDLQIKDKQSVMFGDSQIKFVTGNAAPLQEKFCKETSNDELEHVSLKSENETIKEEIARGKRMMYTINSGITQVKANLSALQVQENDIAKKLAEKEKQNDALQKLNQKLLEDIKVKHGHLEAMQSMMSQLDSLICRYSKLICPTDNQGKGEDVGSKGNNDNDVIDDAVAKISNIAKKLSDDAHLHDSLEEKNKWLSDEIEKKREQLKSLNYEIQQKEGKVQDEPENPEGDEEIGNLEDQKKSESENDSSKLAKEEENSIEKDHSESKNSDEESSSNKVEADEEKSESANENVKSQESEEEQDKSVHEDENLDS